MPDILASPEPTWEELSASERLASKLVCEHYPEYMHALLDHSLRLLMPRLYEDAKRRRDARLVTSQANAAAHVIADLCYGLNPEEENRGILWRHLGDISRLPGSFEKHQVIIRSVQDAAARYLARPLMQHDYLDWCIVDGLICGEWLLYSDELLLPPYDAPFRAFRMFGEIASIAFLCVFGWLLWRAYNSGNANVVWWALLALGFIGLKVTSAVFSRGGPRARAWRIWRAMQRAYFELGAPVLSPTRVREVLKEAEREGVVWPPVVWTILDSAIARNPSVWNVASIQ